MTTMCAAVISGAAEFARSTHSYAPRESVNAGMKFFCSEV